MSDPSGRQLGEPDGAVGGRDGRMNAGCRQFWSRQRELRQLGGLGIEPHHRIAAPVIRDPEHPVLVLDRAPGPHAVVGPEVVLHIGDVHGLRAERAHQGFVLRQSLGRLRLRRVRTERGREIGHEIFEGVVAHASPLHHHFAHVFDPLAPAVLVPCVCRCNPRIHGEVSSHCRSEISATPASNGWNADIVATSAAD
jgi:hypothetical protein